jgi:hypothetical protein
MRQGSREEAPQKAYLLSSGWVSAR